MAHFKLQSNLFWVVDDFSSGGFQRETVGELMSKIWSEALMGDDAISGFSFKFSTKPNERMCVQSVD